MKLNLTRTLVMLAAVVLFYASCKKESKPATSATTTTTAAVDYKALSGQIGLSLYKGITGQYGGTDVAKGITLPSNVNVASHAGLRVNSTASLCGFTVDTTYNAHKGINPVSGDTTTFENFRFTYTCDAGVLDGYIVRDSLVNVIRFNLFGINTTGITQNYAVKALDQTYKLVSMDGSLSSLVETQNVEAPSTQYTSTIYYLVGLRVNFTSGSADITSGTTSFKTTTSDFGPQTNFKTLTTTYYGTITYIGNHKAKVTFTPGASYIVDLTTGVATPA